MVVVQRKTHFNFFETKYEDENEKKMKNKHILKVLFTQLLNRIWLR